MKDKIPLALLGALLGAVAGTAGGSEPLRVSIVKTNGEDLPAYVIKADDKVVQWKYTPDSSGVNTMQIAELKSIKFDDPDEWGDALGPFNAGDYEKAARLFGEIADKYKDIMILKGNPASKAKYLQIECIRQLGQYSKLGELLTEETLGLLNKSLDKQLEFQLAIDTAWAASSAGKWDIVNQLIAQHVLAKEVGEGERRLPEFRKELAQSQAVQLIYMRALSAEANGNKEGALDDFYRTFTLGFGNEPRLSGKAMLKALAILVENPELENERAKLKEVHALATLYKDGFGMGEIPAEYLEYAKPLPPLEGEEGPPAAAEEPAADPVVPAPEGAEKSAAEGGGAKAE